MKRLISGVLLLAMVLSLFAGCSQSGTSAPETTGAPAAQADANLADAVAYVKTIYKTVAEVTGADFQRIGVVPMGTAQYAIEWTTDVSEDLVKITKGADGMVTIDVNEEAAEETPYVLTATLTGTDGVKESLSWNHVLPKAVGGDYAAIVDMGYALEDGQALDFETTMVGTVTTINTAWSDEYGNITVTIIVEGREDKPIMCYRLAGEGAKDLAPGDLITVTGTLKNYKGTIEYDAGCTLDAVEVGAGEVVGGPTDPAEIIAEGYALAQGASLPYPSTLTGKISAINTAWSSQYKNITVTIKVEGFEDKPIMCYRLKGEGAEDLFVDDVITVTGTLKNYGGTIEFDAGCNLDAVTPGPRIPVTFGKQPDSYAQILEDAYKLTDGHYLYYNVYITGLVTKINQEWSDRYGNISVTMVLDGDHSRPLSVYRMVGYENGASEIEVGDMITVHGSIQNYKGTIQICKGCKLMKLEKGDGSYVPPTEPEDPDGTVYSIAQANEVASKKDHNDYTSNKFKVTGVIKEVVNDKYGNMYITDGTNDLYVYGTYDSTGDKRYDKMDVKPVAGDTVTVYGVLGTYKDDPQMKNAWIVSHTPAGGAEPPAPETSEPPVPETSEPPVPETSEPPVPETSEPPVPETSEPPVPETSEPPVPETSEPPKVNASSPVADVYDAAMALSVGEYLDFEYTVTGTVTTAYDWDGKYNNRTVIIQLSNGKTAECYRLKDAANETEKIEVGDTITVKGYLGKRKYEDRVGMKEACVLVSRTPAPAPTIPATLAEQLVEASKLANKKYLSYNSTITGQIIDKPEPSEYNAGEYEFTVSDGTNSVLCYFVKCGDYVPKEGDTVTVTGPLTAYNGAPQFNYKSTCTPNG